VYCKYLDKKINKKEKRRRVCDACRALQPISCASPASGCGRVAKVPHTQPQLRQKTRAGGKHEVARWSICAITPSAVKPPTPINDPACVINADRITCLVHCGRMALQLRLFRGLKIGSGTRVPYGQLSLTPGEHACVINADRITCLVHCGQITLQLRLSRLASEVE
jgi:hypothetical protein